MPLIYLGAKLIIYSVWCYVGMRLFHSPALLSTSYLSPLDSRAIADVENASTITTAKHALFFGFLRLLMGLVGGVVTSLIGGSLVAGAGSRFDKRVLFYVLFLIPARSLEWRVTARIVGKTSPSAPVLLWVLGGVLLSCLADVPTDFAVTDIFWGFC